MIHLNRIEKLREMGVLSKDILATLEYLEGSIEDIPETAMNSLYDYYVSNGEMPYGVMKARDGDPDCWIVKQLEYDLQFI